MNVLHGGHHDAEKYNPTILFVVVVFILVSSSIADITFVDDITSLVGFEYFCCSLDVVSAVASNFGPKNSMVQ